MKTKRIISTVRIPGFTLGFAGAILPARANDPAAFELSKDVDIGEITLSAEDGKMVKLDVHLNRVE